MLHIVDMGTNYGELVTSESRDANNMARQIETEWICHHGAPVRFSADPEIFRPVMTKFLSSHNIVSFPRPSRSSSKNGTVERNNGVFKEILNIISRENTTANEHSLISSTSLLCDIFHGNSIMSAFQLAKGYVPSIFGMIETYIPT